MAGGQRTRDDPLLRGGGARNPARLPGRDALPRGPGRARRAARRAEPRRGAPHRGQPRQARWRHRGREGCGHRQARAGRVRGPRGSPRAATVHADRRATGVPRLAPARLTRALCEGLAMLSLAAVFVVPTACARKTVYGEATPRIETAAGRDVVIDLPSEPTSGQEWRIGALPDGRVLALINADYLDGATASGHQRFTF